MGEYKFLSAEIEKLENEILEKKKKLAELIRKTPAQEVRDYVFGASAGPVKLSQIFGDCKELLLVHNMGKRCPYCTLWADNFNGIRHHLEDRAALAVVSPDKPDVQREFASERGWQFAMYSCAENNFAEDMNFKSGDMYLPGFSTFRKSDDGKIYRTGFRYFGPGDDFCSLWHFFDILPEGANGWEPKYSY